MRYRNPKTMVPRQPNDTPVVPRLVTKARVGSPGLAVLDRNNPPIFSTVVLSELAHAIFQRIEDAPDRVNVPQGLYELCVEGQEVPGDQHKLVAIVRFSSLRREVSKALV